MGHAEVVAETAELCGYSIAGFIDGVHPERQGMWFHGARIISEEEFLRSNPDRTVPLIPGFGDCRGRWNIGERLRRNGIHFLSIIHPSAVISPSARIGTGCFIGACSVVDAGCEVGDFSIINHHACLCHGSRIGRAVHICPASAVAGNAFIGDRCWIGLGSRVIEKISIADDVLVGAGAVVIRNLPSGVLACGVPATIRNREHDSI